jgi:hypothetical protein
MSSDLKARLRSMMSHRGDGIPTQYVNPAGPEAADRIEALEAEVARLRNPAMPAWSEFDHGASVEVARKRESAPEFPGFVIGWYQRLDGPRGYVLQHDPHRIVHVNPEGSVVARAALGAKP